MQRRPILSRTIRPKIDTDWPGLQQALSEIGQVGQTVVCGVYEQDLESICDRIDSNEMAFRIAGSMAFKQAARKANPVVLEPVMNVTVKVREEFVGRLRRCQPGRGILGVEGRECGDQADLLYSWGPKIPRILRPRIYRGIPSRVELWSLS